MNRQKGQNQPVGAMAGRIALSGWAKGAKSRKKCRAYRLSLVIHVISDRCLGWATAILVVGCVVAHRPRKDTSTNCY